MMTWCVDDNLVWWRWLSVVMIT